MGEAQAAQAQADAEREAEDAALVRGLRERQAEACAELYDRFAPGIHRFAVTRLLGDVELAEDVVVETIVDAARDITRFNPRKATLSAWLYGVARRRVNMQIRRRKRGKSVPAWAQTPMEAVREVSDGNDMAARAAARLDAQQRVAEMAIVLSGVEMEVLTLSCIEQLSVREIGQVIGRSERAVHSILHRAKTKARERSVRENE